MSDCRAQVEILLATYNGDKYLDRQLESIEAQTFKDWRILARDDGSTDRTCDILRDWKSRLGERLEIIDDGKKKNIGVIGNFERLLKASGAPYLSFSDQDDFWIDTKLAKFIDAMDELEAEHGPARPCLVFSDLSVTDDDLCVTHKSFWAYQRIYPEIVFSKKSLALSNCVTGCAMMINQAAAQCSMPMTNATMHDWWIAISVANAKGGFSVIRDQTVLYRQHAANTIGAKRAGLVAWARKISSYCGDLSDIKACYRQARHFIPRMGKYEFLFSKAALIIRRYLMSLVRSGEVD